MTNIILSSTVKVHCRSGIAEMILALLLLCLVLKMTSRRLEETRLFIVQPLISMGGFGCVLTTLTMEVTKLMQVGRGKTLVK
jgi:hypothetical protein